MRTINDFKKVPKSDWPANNNPDLKRLYVNSQFLVQEFHEESAIRLSICKTTRRNGKWEDGITWDQLQEIKSKVGYPDQCAVEVYPENKNVVNVANMRHLFVLAERPRFAWSKK